MVHECGDISIIDNIYLSDSIEQQFNNWAKCENKKIICDVNMVKMGIISRYFQHDIELISAIDQPNLDLISNQIQNTKTAAGIHALKDQFNNAILVIGNAPTALFHLLDLVEQGYPAPYIIIGCPVGFVGAAESKEALIDAKLKHKSLSNTSIITLKGRLGGSAIASASLNAMTKFQFDNDKNIGVR